MMNHATTEVFFDNMAVPADSLIGEEGKGFRYILSGMNAERILIASECIGDAKWFIDKATAYAKERVLFGRPIGQNQGVQFPIARCYMQMRAAELMVHEAARLYEAGEDCGEQANMAKQLAAEASWAAADMCLQTHGGFGFAEEFDIERKFRETRLYTVAPISTNLVLSYIAEHVLGLPRSYLSTRLPCTATSWPGLSRPSTSLHVVRCVEDVDARHKASTTSQGDDQAGRGSRGTTALKASSSSRSNRPSPRRCARAGSPTPARASSRSSGRRAISRAATTRWRNGQSSYFVWLNRGKESRGAGSRQGRRQGAARSHAREGRRVHPEPQARRGGQARLRARAAAARLSAADRLLGVGLRRERALRGAQGLRHADPGRGRRRLGDRRAGGAVAGRRVGLRHRVRHERLRGDARSADRARPHRGGRGDLGVDVRRHGRLDDGAAPAARGRLAAQAHRPRPHLDLALRRVQVQGRRRHPDFDPERPRMARSWPRRCWATRRSPPIRTLPPTSSG